MNIFYIDYDPKQAAQWMVDTHVVKMILESAQLLSTAHRVLDGKKQIILTQDKYVTAYNEFDEKYQKLIKGRKKTVWTLFDERENIIYEATHINHPSAIWTRSSIENYTWLVEHFFALCEEYTHRYNRVHKTFSKGYLLQSPPKNLSEYDMTDIPLCMPDEYKIQNDCINSYRNYYRFGKKELHNWTNRTKPEWI